MHLHTQTHRCTAPEQATETKTIAQTGTWTHGCTAHEEATNTNTSSTTSTRHAQAHNGQEPGHTMQLEELSLPPPSHTHT
eukprot:1145299-Pelagomonas_calceolata.AAC.2